MSWIRARRRARPAARHGVALTALALLVGGCGLLSTEEDRNRAEELAEQVYPGELRVVGARTLFPADSGSEITFALRDDPEAFVRLRVDAERDRCEGGAPCARALREARARGEAAAAEWRLLRGELEHCGYEVHAVRVTRDAVAEPWISVPLSNRNLTGVLDRLGGCLERYSRALPSAARTGRTAINVNIAAPEAVRSLPRGKQGDPVLLRKSSTKLLAALASGPYHAVSYAWRDGAVLPGSGTPRRVLPFEDNQEFVRAVHTSTARWLRRTHPQAQVVEGYSGIWSLRPGRLDRQRGYVLYCEGPESHPGHRSTGGTRSPRADRCLGNHALVVTVDLRGNLLDEPRVERDVREGRGPLNLPPLDG
ncbi:hypothetical protein ABZ929_05295 [Streptomyces physcomitrii]|uniref:SCO7460 family lipoprotein n=1 Tax=Streptomyces physcomitrii TaxID=2724184 RepID=UPI0034021A18